MTVEIECRHGHRGEARRCPITKNDVRDFAEWWHESVEMTVHILSKLDTSDHPDWYADTNFTFNEVCCGGWYSEEDFAANFSVVDDAIQEPS